MAILYAMTDEYHQMFSKGRTPSLVDIFLFDNLGALIGLWLAGRMLPVNENRGVSDPAA